MFNPFKLYDEMLGIYAETVLGAKDEAEPNYTVLEYTVPEDLADELDRKVRLWLLNKGIDLGQEDATS